MIFIFNGSIRVVPKTKENMKYLLNTFLAALAFTACYSQSSSESTITIGDVFTELNRLNYTDDTKLVYKKYKHFDFSDFSPVAGHLDSLDYFEVGYSKNGSIKEVIRHAKKHQLLNYMFKVHDSGRFRILVLKELQNGEYYFTSLAFLITKHSNDCEYYMIDLVVRFGKERPPLAFSYKEFPVTGPENISAITKLNNNLYPERELKILDSRILMSSDYIYRRDNPRVIDAEVINFFFTPDESPAARITSKTKFLEIMQRESIAEYQLGVKPDMHDLDTEPLWILKGNYLYVK